LLKGVSAVFKLFTGCTLLVVRGIIYQYHGRIYFSRKGVDLSGVEGYLLDGWDGRGGVAENRYSCG